MLSYTVTKTTTLTVPKHWGMFSSAGNKRIANMAQKLVTSLEADKSYKNYVKQVTSFIKKYRNLSSFKTYNEASDSMVRDIVYDFLEKVHSALGYYSLQDIWDVR